jgi:hypothetical protein
MPEHYEFVEKPGTDFTAIRIKVGKYKGIIFVYGKVGFKDTDPPEMIFNYQVLANPKNVETLDQEFIDLIGDWLNSILLEEVESGRFNGIKFKSGDV